MKRMNTLLIKGFQASKCKTQLRLGTSRIKLLRNKKRTQIASDRREVAELLRNGQENNARLLVEHVIMEQDLIEAYDLLYLYAERIAAQLSVIESQKTCPLDLKEDISTLLYASSRCAELPDFAQIRPMFVAKYGKEFVSAAIELRPGCGVNGKVIEKLSSNGATGGTKLKLMKEIAAEYNVVWDPAPFEREIRVDHDDVLVGPTRTDTSSILVDDFPSVPSQKPVLGARVSQPENFTTQTSGSLDKEEPTNLPRPGDYRTDSPGALPRAGPPSRNPPGRDQSRAEELTFDDRHSDMDPESRETQNRRNQRRESDSFLAPFPLARHQVEESRRNSIGVPREKSVRAHSGSGHADMDESLLQDLKKHNLRDAGIQDFEEASHRKSGHGREYESGFDGRQSQTFAGKEISGKGRPQHEDEYAEEDKFRRVSNRDGSGKGRPQHEDEYAEEDKFRRVSNRDGSGKGRPQYQDEHAEVDYLRRVSRDGSGKGRPQYQDEHAEVDYLRRVSRDGSGKGRPQYQDEHAEVDNLRKATSREGSGKGRPQYQDEHAEVDNLRKATSREGSGKGRPQHQDQYAEQDNLRRASSREGSGDKMPFHETLVDEGSGGRISGRGKEDKLHSRKNRKHNDSDEDADHVPHRSEEPRRRESTSNTPKYLDEDDHNPEWDDERFRQSITTRMPRNSEDESRNSGKRRDSLNRRTPVEDMSRQSNNPAVPKKEVAGYLNERAIPDRPHYDSSGDEYDSPRGGARKPEPRYKTTDTRNSDRPSESGEEGSRKDTRRTSRLSIADEQRRDPQDDQGSSRGKRHGREDPVKTSRRPYSDYDDQMDSDDDHFITSSRTTKDLEKRMSLPGGSDQEKLKHQGNLPNDDHDDSIRRRSTIGPEVIRRDRARETEDPPRSRYGEREKQVESRRQSAPLSKEDVMEGRHLHRDKTDRHRKTDILAGYDDERPTRFSVSLQDDDEYSPSTRTSRDRSDRQRKADIPARYDDGRPPPRFTKVGKQPNLDDEDVRASPAFKGEKPQRFVNRNDQQMPRPRPNLQSAKTDPELSGTPKISSVPEHRKSQSAFAESSSKASTPRLQKPSPEETQSPKQAGQPPSKPTFMKPPDLDSLIQMFGNKGKKK